MAVFHPELSLLFWYFTNTTSSTKKAPCLGCDCLPQIIKVFNIDFFFFRWAILQSSGDVFYQNCRSSSSKEIQQQQQWLCKFYHHNTTAAVAAAQVGSNFGILFKTLSRRRKLKILRYTKSFSDAAASHFNFATQQQEQEQQKHFKLTFKQNKTLHEEKFSFWSVKSHLWQNGRCK